MKNLTYSILTGLLLCALGCSQDKYEIELTPQDDKVKRELTYSNSNTSAFAQEVKRIEKEYGAKADWINESARLSDVVGPRMPNDVGGYGGYKKWNSPMGSLTLYHDRFRGSHDYASQLKSRHEAVEDMGDLLVDWLGIELGHLPDWDKVKKFFEDDFRNDMHNLSIGIWQTGFQTDNRNPESWFRLGQFLIEREYVELDQVPRLIRSFQDGRFPLPLMESIRSRLNVHLGSTEAAKEATKIFSGESEFGNSFNRYVAKSDLIQDILLPKWSEIAGDKLKKRDLVSEILYAAFWPPSAPMFSPTVVKVKLNSQLEPILTNGRWDSKAGTVDWDQEIGDAEQENVPGFAYSVVAQPDSNYQAKHFGIEILKGKQLANYVLWYNGLEQAEQKRIDDLINGIEPTSKIALELSKFEQTDGSSFLNQGVRQLKGAFAAKKDKSAGTDR